MAVTGSGGQLLVGYQPAARIGQWSLEPSAGGWVVRATFTRRDAYWITQRPLRLVLEIGGLRWTWNDVDARGDGIYVSAPPQEGLQDGTNAVRNSRDPASLPQ